MLVDPYNGSTNWGTHEVFSFLQNDEYWYREMQRLIDSAYLFSSDEQIDEVEQFILHNHGDMAGLDEQLTEWAQEYNEDLDWALRQIDYAEITDAFIAD